MKTDTYTKVMLTIIALCLVLICLSYMNHQQMRRIALAQLAADEVKPAAIGFTALPFSTV